MLGRLLLSEASAGSHLRENRPIAFDRLDRIGMLTKRAGRQYRGEDRLEFVFVHVTSPSGFLAASSLEKAGRAVTTTARPFSPSPARPLGSRGLTPACGDTSRNPGEAGLAASAGPAIVSVAAPPERRVIARKLPAGAMIWTHPIGAFSP